MIRELGRSWEIPDVQYRGSSLTCRLQNTPLEDGRRQTQQDWSEHARTRFDQTPYYLRGNNVDWQNNFRSPDMPLVYAIIRRLHTASNQEDHIASEISSFLRQVIGNGMMTLSQIDFEQQSIPIVNHNPGTPVQYRMGCDFTERNELNAEQRLALLGTCDTTNSVYDTFTVLGEEQVYGGCYSSQSPLDMEHLQFPVTMRSFDNSPMIYCTDNLDTELATIGVAYDHVKVNRQTIS